MQKKKRRVYLFSGIIAASVGLAQAFVGYHSSSSLLSDALHAISDGFADLAGFVAIATGIAALQKWAIRFVSFSLVVAALWIIVESFSRIIGGFVVNPANIVIMGLVGMVADMLRVNLFSRIRSSGDYLTESLLLHAKSDLYRSVGVALFGVIAGSFAGFPALVRVVDGAIAIFLAGYMGYLAVLTFKMGKHVCVSSTHNCAHSHCSHHHEHEHEREHEHEH